MLALRSPTSPRRNSPAQRGVGGLVGAVSPRDSRPRFTDALKAGQPASTELLRAQAQLNSQLDLAEAALRTRAGYVAAVHQSATNSVAEATAR